MKTEKFDVLNAQLEGINLVEASAGTGKTYSIALLFLRWILSERYNGKIDSVVVVTFTKYATAELKERILLFLEKALAFLQGADCDDRQIREVCCKIPPENRENAVQNLKSAINTFDTASIFTIHGFCRKLILENAFEIGSSFTLDLAEDPDVSRETSTEFFRKVLAENSDREFLSAAKKELSVKNFETLLKKAGNSAPSEITIDESRFPDPAAREKLAALYMDFLKKAPEIAAENRRKSGKMTYDDLISVIAGILGDPNMAGKLKNSMKERYGLVMIDEFQDTDPLQYSIFKELFCGGNHAVFFIGDPKQSIYSFRNADIFSYLKAADAVDRKYFMEKNFRSTAAAVNAVNNIFKKINFSINEITYQKIEPKEDAPNRLEIRKNQQPVPAPGMVVYEIGSDDEIISNIKERIGNMLRDDSDYTLCGEAVKPSDIAILVRTNRFAAEIFSALKEEKIPVSLESDGGKGDALFASPEAAVLFRLIKAAETPGLAEFKALLPTFFYNKNVEWIARNEEKIQRLYEDFGDTFSEWEKKGFFAVFSKFTEKSEILSGITSGGAETLARIRYLAELVNNFETLSGFSRRNTAEWFGQKLGSPQSASDEEMPESWENAGDTIKIMTLHKSKGLEFNIVLFAFNSGGGSGEWISQHDPGYRKEIRLVKYSNRDRKVQGDDEPEETREFYVGITRAKYLTVYYLPKETFDGTINKKFRELLQDRVDFVKYIPKAENSPGQTEEKQGFRFEDPLEKYRKMQMRPPEEPERALKPDWALSSFSGIVSTNQVDDEYVDEKLDDMPEKTRTSTVPSYTARGKELSEMALFPRGTEPGLALHSVFEKIDFSAPDNSVIIREILKKEMNFEGDELEKTVEAVCGCVRNVLNAPMLEGSALKDVKNHEKRAEMKFFFTIKENVRKKRIFEIIKENFNCGSFDEESVLKGFMTGSIDLVLKSGGKYYIIDWKSNFLGESFEDYNAEKITEEMKKHCYYLQYMIYLAAFDRYMTEADPAYSYEKDFGGIRYVFLRGVKAQSGDHGIFYDRPEEALLRKFQKLFEGEK